MQQPKTIFAVAVASMLNSCVGYPRLVNYPFIPGGQGLNSPAAELTPQVTQRYIVFSSDRRGRQDIYLYDKLNRQLVDLPGLNSLDTISTDPAISGDSRYIVFAATRQGKSNIMLYDRETNQLRNLTANLQSDVRNPTISSDGSTIAFESSANGQWDILVYNKYGNPLNIPMSPR
ncbi:MAG: Tol biopolymer transporter periplasmic protein [Microcoleaceae cyanobacterium MO_207.B10]|nr:Tol biopolymer transporter periplasmic protein [Microcoleaceae cyanobacterium MO_207.B10]